MGLLACMASAGVSGVSVRVFVGVWWEFAECLLTGDDAVRSF